MILDEQGGDEQQSQNRHSHTYISHQNNRSLCLQKKKKTRKSSALHETTQQPL